MLHSTVFCKSIVLVIALFVWLTPNDCCHSNIEVKMPKAFSSDIRWRVVWLHVFLKLSSAEVSDLLFISKKSVERYSNKFITTGDVEPKTHKCGPYKKLSEEVILIDLVLNNPDIFLHELQYDLKLWLWYQRYTT